jgi:hypothetical protein
MVEQVWVGPVCGGGGGDAGSKLQSLRQNFCDMDKK